jgi:hypothetical protein
MWHWSPDHNWDVDLPIKGWNEALVTYVLAASSPTHPIDKQTYHQGWASGTEFNTNHKTHGITIPLGPVGGGPLFLSQYSFQGLAPNGLRDQYADYQQQVEAHTRANYRHCKENPFGYKGYGKKCWGLTSSFNHMHNGQGYDNHSPTNDLGVITPTAALSAMPFLPDASILFLKHAYDDHPREKIMGKYGLVDAFKSDGSWYANGHLAIDQGPIINMIENHRSGLLWNLFMRTPEVQDGLRKLDFKSPYLAPTMVEKKTTGWQQQIAQPELPAHRQR